MAEMMNETGKKHHFVLVHGACHGAWCWYKLSTLLKSAGHKVTTLDLGASGVDPRHVNDLRSFADYFEPLMNFMEHSLPATITALDERVILVGHSLGGLSISKAMESYPEKISIAVFVTAFMPDPALDFPSIVQVGSRGDSRYTYDDGPENPPTTFIFGPNYLASNLYQLCPPEVLNLATMMMRPIPLHSKEDIPKHTVVSLERYGSVRRVYIVCDEDMAIPEAAQRQIIKNDPMVEVKEIIGSNHMVMLSKPRELFACLQEIAGVWYLSTLLSKGK